MIDGNVPCMELSRAFTAAPTGVKLATVCRLLGRTCIGTYTPAKNKSGYRRAIIMPFAAP